MKIGGVFLLIGLIGAAVIATAAVGGILWMAYRFLKRRVPKNLDTIV